MDESTFWKLIEAAKSEATPELSNQPEILQEKLEALEGIEIIEFQRIFSRLFDQAYTWDLWAAGYIIEGGCSDDGFMDFRAGLIGLGRQAYYDAMKDPQSLSIQPKKGVDFSQEGMLYAARRAYETVTGEDEMPEDERIRPSEPAGEPWEEERVAEKYPKLAQRFEF